MHPALAHDAATAFAKIYEDGIKTARERLAADAPLREDEAEDVERLVGPEHPSFDAYWTKGDEENFMKEWNESEEKRRIDTVEIRNAPLHRLWKSCVRLMHARRLPSSRLETACSTARRGKAQQSRTRHS